MQGVRVDEIATDQLAAFFDAISMTNPAAPAPGALRTENLPHEPGTVLTADFDDDGLAWAGDALGDDDPLRLMPRAVSVPRLVTAIWLGGPPDPADRRFWDGLQDIVSYLDDDARVVLLTDVPRSEFEAVRGVAAQGNAELTVREDGGDGDQSERAWRLAAAGAMLSWAIRNHVLLVNVDEVSHAGQELALDHAYRAELARRTANGYARASDVLRFSFAERFGTLLYTDHDNAVGAEVRDASDDALEQSEAWDGAFQQSLEDLFMLAGWAMHIRDDNNALSNAAFMAGRDHPFPTWVLSEMETRYGVTQRELYLNQPEQYAVGYQPVPVSPDINEALAHRWATDSYYRVRRTSVMLRTGPHVLWPFMDSDAPRITQLEIGQAGTWRRGHPLGRQRAYLRDEVPGVVRDVVATLVRDLYNREGDLHLTLVAPVIAGLPDPEAGWRAAVGFILSRRDLRDLIMTITDRLAWAPDGEHAETVVVALPGDVRAALSVPDG
jgi:hypothetical protein